MIKILPKEKLFNFVNLINKEYDTYLPIKKGGLLLFHKISDYEPHKVDLERKTALPPSIKFLPLKEELMNLEDGDFKENFQQEEQALFGVHSTDLKALARLDEILIKDGEDSFYKNRRDKTIIIGLREPASLTPFHKALASEKIAHFDIFLAKKHSDYLAVSGSKTGDGLLESSLFKPGPQAGFSKESRQPEPHLNLELISWAIEKTKGGRVWQKWADKCLGCGNCSYVCPLCFCYELDDEICLNGKISRVRTQSSCFLKSFNQMTGYNPKKEFINRFYSWYYHKFVQMPQKYGFSGCVNCGRCINACPADINFRQVLKEVIEEAQG